MKKVFTLLTLALMSIGSVWGESITIKWLDNMSGAGTTEPSYEGTASVDGIVTVNDMTKTSTLTFAKVEVQKGINWANYTSSTAATKNYFSVKDYFECSITIPAGYNFTPTSVTALVGGAGTGNNGAQLFEQGNFPKEDAKSAIKKASEGGTTLSITPESKTYNNETYTVRVYFGINSKQNDISNVIITGTYVSASAEPVAASITTQPTDQVTNAGESTTLSVEATGYPAPDYQWYSCDDAEKTNAAAIDGATSSSYTFTPEAEGTLYFYVTVENEKNASPVESDVVKVTVNKGTVLKPTFTVYGNTVQLACATADATIYYELDNADVKTSASKVKYSGAFIPASSGTVYAYAAKDGYNDSDVTSQAITLSTVGDVVGGLIATVQPADKEDKTTTFNNITISSDGTLGADGRGKYVSHFKASGKITLTAADGQKIQSIKIYGTSNDGSKVSSISAGEGATVVSTPAELMQRDVVVEDVQAMTEIVITVDEPAENNSVSFTLGRESRLYVLVYGEGSVSAKVAASGYTTYASASALDFANAVEEGTTNKTLTAFVVSNVTKESVTLTPVESAPASTGVVLKGTASTTYTIPVVKSAASVGTNKLTASVSGATVEANSVYVVSGGKFCLYTGTSIPAGKAYLPKSEVPASASELNLDFNGETTGISTVDSSKKSFLDGDFYNLAGQRVAQPTKGLYIVNGRKVVIK